MADLYSRLKKEENLLLENIDALLLAQKKWEAENYHTKGQFYLFLPEQLLDSQIDTFEILKTLKNYLANFKFSPTDIYHLMAIKKDNVTALFSESFLNYLQRLKPPNDLTTFPKGNDLFPNKSFLLLKTSSLQGQLLKELFNQLVCEKS